MLGSRPKPLRDISTSSGAARVTGGTYTPAAGEQDRACICSFARLCADNFSHTEWLYDGQILRDATRVAVSPGVMVHGRLDLGGPADVPWLLHRARSCTSSALAMREATKCLRRCLPR